MIGPKQLPPPDEHTVSDVMLRLADSLRATSSAKMTYTGTVRIRVDKYLIYNNL